MKKTYRIEVDCANCANNIESAVRKMPGVAACTINFMTQKMVLEPEDGQDDNAVIKAVVKTAKRIEPDFQIEL